MTAGQPRTHVLTGAGSGIGAELAARLQARGDQLWLLARSEERAVELAGQFAGARTLVADLADPGGLESALEAGLAAGRLPERVDSLVHAAGVVDLAPVTSFDRQAWQQQLDVNLTAPALLTRALLPALRAAGGTVVFVNSGAGLSASPTWSGYAASKFGLRALADALRGEERPQGVRVTTVYPGRTATPMQQKVHAQEGKEYDASDWIEVGTVAATILHVLDLPRDATIPDVQVSPGP
ncbi:SDR family oxidoreductase [Nocardioides panaciterrulae]|uniref:Short-subunit dehydrogenase n=1 Tax=Nocardioides panaciterrulae TaxID=661492 RepID=A0A7Y9E4Y7_9ACTN|nr:SDR family oxidoreductase [Nocardioides panaciterrulae]NYD41220.1 short-subunit dehydrogenase [Nocardioides panaciterrulae]